MANINDPNGLMRFRFNSRSLERFDQNGKNTKEVDSIKDIKEQPLTQKEILDNYKMGRIGVAETLDLLKALDNQPLDNKLINIHSNQPGIIDLRPAKRPLKDLPVDNNEIEDSRSIESSIPVYASLKEGRAAATKFIQEKVEQIKKQNPELVDRNSYVHVSYKFRVGDTEYVASTYKFTINNPAESLSFGNSISGFDTGTPGVNIYEVGSDEKHYDPYVNQQKQESLEKYNKFEETGIIAGDSYLSTLYTASDIINKKLEEGTIDNTPPIALTFLSEYGSKELPDGTRVYPENTLTMGHYEKDSNGLLVKGYDNYETKFTGFYVDEQGNRYDKNLNLIGDTETDTDVNPNPDLAPDPIPQTPVFDNGVNGELDTAVGRGINMSNGWMIADVLAVANTEIGKSLIKDSIVSNEDGSVTVTFKGVNQSYTISPEEIAKFDTDKILTDKYSNGDNDMLVLELAMEKLSNDVKSGKVKPEKYSAELKQMAQDMADGGTNYEMPITWLLSGVDKEVTSITNKSQLKSELQELQGVTVKYPGLSDSEALAKAMKDLGLRETFYSNGGNVYSQIHNPKKPAGNYTEQVHYYWDSQNREMVEIPGVYFVSSDGREVKSFIKNYEANKSLPKNEDNPNLAVVAEISLSAGKKIEATCVDGSKFTHSANVNCTQNLVIKKVENGTVTFVNPYEASGKEYTMTFDEFAKLNVVAIEKTDLNNVINENEDLDPEPSPIPGAEPEPKPMFNNKVNGEFDEKISRGRNMSNGWLISSALAVANTEVGAQMIKDSIVSNEDGSVTVTLKGVNVSYTITPEEIAIYDTDLNLADKYSNGDNDMLVLELAMEKLSNDVKSGKVKPEKYSAELKQLAQDMVDGGTNYNMPIAWLLTGVDTQITKVSSNTKELTELNKLYKEGIENSAVTVDISMNAGKAINLTCTDGTVYSYTPSKTIRQDFVLTAITSDTVTFLNPYENSGKEITVPYLEFMKLNIVQFERTDLSSFVKNDNDNDTQIDNTIPVPELQPAEPEYNFPGLIDMAQDSIDMQKAANEMGLRPTNCKNVFKKQLRGFVLHYVWNPCDKQFEMAPNIREINASGTYISRSGQSVKEPYNVHVAAVIQGYTPTTTEGLYSKNGDYFYYDEINKTFIEVDKDAFLK